MRVSFRFTSFSFILTHSLDSCPSLSLSHTLSTATSVVFCSLWKVRSQNRDGHDYFIPNYDDFHFATIFIHVQFYKLCLSTIGLFEQTVPVSTLFGFYMRNYAVCVCLKFSSERANVIQYTTIRCNHKYNVVVGGWCWWLNIMVDDIPANLIGNCYEIQIIAFGAHAYLELKWVVTLTGTYTHSSSFESKRQTHIYILHLPHRIIVHLAKWEYDVWENILCAPNSISW